MSEQYKNVGGLKRSAKKSIAHLKIPPKSVVLESNHMQISSITPQLKA